MPLAHDRHVATGGPHEPPLELASHEHRRVGQEMEARLEGKEQQEGELVQPVQVVGDDDVVAAPRPRDVLSALDVELEAEPEQGDPDHAHDPIRNVGARPYW